MERCLGIDLSCRDNEVRSIEVDSAAAKQGSKDALRSQRAKLGMK
jgi:hypothetical protein